MMVAWVIILGKKVRTGTAGVRADFCSDCLRVTRCKVKTVETIGHLYYIPLGSYSLQAVIGECQTCGAQSQLSNHHLRNVVAEEAASELTIAQLVDKTNPGLHGKLSDLARRIDVQIPVADRDTFLMSRFCAWSSELFKQAEHQLSGWVGVVLLVFLVAGGFAFGLAGPVPGIVTAVTLAMALLAIRHWAIQHWVAKRLKPQVERFLSGTGLAWAGLQDGLESGTFRFPRLCRHLRRSTYDAFRHDWTPADLPDQCDVIVPAIDEEAERREAERQAAVAAQIRRSVDSTAGGAKSNWQIVECQSCGMNVIPKSNGICPSCQAELSNTSG